MKNSKKLKKKAPKKIKIFPFLFWKRVDIKNSNSWPCKNRNWLLKYLKGLLQQRFQNIQFVMRHCMKVFFQHFEHRFETV